MEDKVLILDGGMSRELVRLGATLRQPEWSALALMDSPEIVKQVHSEFIEAGADVITTNSYALVPYHIGEDRFRNEGAVLIKLAGRLAREAADEHSGRTIQVAGSLPPIFGSYEPRLFRADDVQDYLSILVSELSPLVDLWLGETLSLIAEAQAVKAAVADTGKPFWVSFTLDDEGHSGNRAPRLRSGETVEDAARWAAGAGAAALLFNCSRPEVMEVAVDAARRIMKSEGGTVRIGVYANAFEPDGEGAANETLSDVRTDLDVDRYCAFASDWVQGGASIVGGCCGIGAAHIRRLANKFAGTRSHGT